MTTPFLRRTIGLLALVFSVFLFAGCDSGSDDGDGGGGSGNGTLTATVGGSSFTATTIVALYTNGVLSIAGNLGATSPQRQINLNVPGAALGTRALFGTATYGEGSSLTDLKAYAAISGSVTIDELSDSGAKGTFSFTGRANDNTEISVTNGEFDVTF